MSFFLGALLGVFLGAALGFFVASLCAIARASVDEDCSGWEDE